MKIVSIKEARNYKTHPEIIFEKLKKIVKDAGFKVKIVNETNKRLKFSTPMTHWSWGHLIEVTVNREEDGGSQVYVKSKPKLWTNIAAYGRTKRNVRRIFEILEKDIK
ncbi:MAG: hypothetical protein WED07_12365 [Candidatus Freyarchaeum deiterrae]